MPDTPAAEHPLRHCDVCKQVDDHPRHVHGTSGLEVDKDFMEAALEMDLPTKDRARIVATIADATTQVRHMDCCREAGCPDGTCDSAPALKGQELRDHIIGASAPAATPTEG